MAFQEDFVIIISLTKVFITVRAIAAWTTFVRSKQSMQFTRNTLFWSSINPPSSTLWGNTVKNITPNLYNMEALHIYKNPDLRMSIYRSDIHFGAVQPCSSNKCFSLYYFILYLVFMLSTYIFSSLTQLTIYTQFLRDNYKEFGFKSTQLLVAILKLFVSLNAMAGDSVGVEDCEIDVHDTSLPSTSSQNSMNVAWIHCQPLKE